MELSTKILSDVVVHMKYAKYLPDQKRRESWTEIVDRNKAMQLKKYPQMREEIDWAYQFVYERKVLPSMRGLQFSGRPIELIPSRQFNCSFLPIDDRLAFSEVMYLLLGGSGVGISVQKHHVAKLPRIIRSTKTRRYLIGDSIVGWSDAIKVLMKSYFTGNPSPSFDFSDIRPKGSLLKTSGGIAPGPEPLKDCLHNVQKILDRKQSGSQLTPLEVHDICCHIADAVLAGGIRRSAMISLFSLDDSEMLEAKAGNWFELNPQRGRANNSAVVLRHKIDKKTFLSLWDRIRRSGSGEPGLLLSHDKEVGTNPCQPAHATVLTPHGIRTIGDLRIGDTIWSGRRWTAVTNKWFTGVKPVYKYVTRAGNFIGTENHRIVCDGSKMEVRYAEAIDSSVGPGVALSSINEVALADGLGIGDGTVHSASNKIVEREFLGNQEVFDLTVDDEDHTYWTGGLLVSNCGEVSLRPFEFCNLTTINVGDIATQQELDTRARAASIIGTLQAGYTNFSYLRDVWKETTEKEALIGVSMTGIASGKLNKLNIRKASKIVAKTNEQIAKRIGINKAARCTVVKPEGSSSLVLGTSSGIHAWHSKFYIRRIRVGKNEPIYTYLAINNPELLEDDFFRPTSQAVISIPQKAPKEAITRDEKALSLLTRVAKTFKEWIKPGHRSGHNYNNVSCTVSIKPEEWKEVGEWMWRNRNSYTALSILPFDGGTYTQAPYQEIDEETFVALEQKLKEIDLNKVVELHDNTNLKGEAACAGGSCEIQ